MLAGTTGIISDWDPPSSLLPVQSPEATQLFIVLTTTFGVTLVHWQFVLEDLIGSLPIPAKLVDLEAT